MSGLEISGAGVVADVFEISGRGVVVLLEKFDGSARIGDSLAFGAAAFEIGGVEIPRYNSVEAAEDGKQRSLIGLLLSSCTKTQMDAYRGHEAQIVQAL